MKGLTLTQPWAWAVVFEGKDIENRTWKTKYRGPLLIHAAKGITKRSYNEAKNFMLSIGLPRVPLMDELDYGMIIGETEVVGCIAESDYGLETSEWFQGPHGWVLQNTRQIKPIPYKGSLGLWNFDGKITYV